MIVIRNATENNLKSVSLEIPENKLIVVTGVSGSGKSTLVFDVIYREAERRYLGSFSANARQLLGKMRRPEAEMITGLSPAIAVKQSHVTGNQRSTVGTLTGIYDHLRLLFARLGKRENSSDSFPIDRSLFSFNTPAGACPACKGLGVQDRLDPELLVADPSKTLREGCLVITAPNGYIIYSQVTMDVLDQVCRSEGFHTGIPWRDLTPEQKHVILYGSSKIEIPFGKHPLESRMKWSGITAKPREMGYYKGIMPIMEEILQRDRNKNILRFVLTGECQVCNGRRLNEKALSVKVHEANIATLAGFQLDELHRKIRSWVFTAEENSVAEPIISAISKRLAILERLGLGYLSLSRDASGLSAGEARRLHLATQSLNTLSGLIYIFDEPSIGMHSRENQALISVLKELRNKGNTVIVVEHDEEFIRHADWLIDIGPGPGLLGGEVLFNMDTAVIPALSDHQIDKSRTLRFLTGREKLDLPSLQRLGNGELLVSGAAAHNLKNIDVRFLLGTMNVITGVAGAGKSTLTHHILGNFLRNKFSGTNLTVGNHREISGWEKIKKLVDIDQSPIGRTPRSNPATYTGLFDHIRDLFALQPEAMERGLDKSSFSFNTAGGRCEYCEGAGYQQIGMHFMGSVEVICESCEGRRFNDATLSVTYLGKSISEVLEMTVAQALEHFRDELKILRSLLMLDSLGLGYLTLGQRSSTLSGGEAQRIKLATELGKPASGHNLYILDEPSTGLHMADLANLFSALNRLVDQGHTMIIIEHHPALIALADRMITLGPGSGHDGGQVVFCGRPERSALDEQHAAPIGFHGSLTETQKSIVLKGVTTHNLKNIDVEIPINKVTVLTGVSGSGKSSLAFDTIFAEGQNRFLESYSTYIRTRLGVNDQAGFDEIYGLTATFAIDQNLAGTTPRSTVGTMTGIYDFYRLLFSRIGISKYEIANRKPNIANYPSSSLFSFNHQMGACPACGGLGSRILCDAAKLITDPEKSILTGAMDATKTGKFYGDPFGQYVAMLEALAIRYGYDFSLPWNQLSDNEKAAVLNGTGNESYDVTWQFRRNQRTGEHRFMGPWQGLLTLVNEEYRRKHADHRGEGMMNVMMETVCDTCGGTRLNSEALEYLVGGKNIGELCAMPVAAASGFLSNSGKLFAQGQDEQIAAPLILEIRRRLEFLSEMGLDYLAISRSAKGLSGGEAQRIKLAAQLGLGLTGVTYVLDEPTLGLHASDTARLMNQIRRLKEEGNTIVIVEHDRQVIMAADHVIDLGPGAGTEGGYILARGTPQEIISSPESVTGPYLVPRPGRTTERRPLKPGLSIKNAHIHNLKGFDLEIPSGGIIIITGVSGSGKSSLVFDLIHTSHLQMRPVGCSAISGFQRFSHVVPIHPKTHFGGTGTPATYTGIFDRVRGLFAKTPDAVSLGFGKNHFSFLSREGRCDSCQGAGRIKVSMDFLSDVWSDCEICNGMRYRQEILDVRIRGHHIGDILDMTFVEARAFFGTEKSLMQDVSMMERVGLGYLHLGQSLDTLSGGEAQRLFLATELMKPGLGNTLYLFEEPATGLHFKDIEYLLSLFGELAGQGHTLLVIEHDPDVIACADKVISLGPGGGDKGGEIIAAGT